MTAFADITDLRTAVVEHVADPSIADVFPRLVKLAEVHFNRKLRTREMMATATVTFTNGLAPLPSDYLEAIGLFDQRGYEYTQQPIQNVKLSNRYATEYYYAIDGSNVLMTAGDGDRELEYYQGIPTITDSDTDSNWLLQKHPAAYLYCVGFEAAKYMRNVELAQATQPLMDMEITAVMGQDFNDRYSRARIRQQGCAP